MVRKLYYTIGEVAKEFNIHASTIRHWEKDLGCLHSTIRKRNIKGDVRQFSELDVQRIRTILAYIRRGNTLEGVKMRLEESDFSFAKTI